MAKGDLDADSEVKVDVEIDLEVVLKVELGSASLLDSTINSRRCQSVFFQTFDGLTIV